MTPEVSRGSYKRILGVLFHLTKLVNEGVGLQTLLRAVSDASVGLVGADSCSIMLLDEGREELLCKAASGLSDQEEDGNHFRVGEGLAGWVAQHGQAARVPDAAADARFVAVPGQALQIRSLLAVPLSTREGVIGVMTVTSQRPNAFLEDHEELLMYLGTSIVKDIENARLYRLSITDSLTKAYNRQYLYQRLPDEVDRCRRFGDPLCVLLFDVDHFKKLNDSHGHPAGDFVLKELVRRVGQTVRGVDGLVRFGGEEFLLILPRTEMDGAKDLAERVRAAVADGPFGWHTGPLSVTVSLGVSALKGPEDTDEGLLKRADDALYDAKSSGRNTVRVR